MNYYRRYSGDYLRDTARLSMLEHGAYCLLLDYYYSEEQPLPLDLAEIYTMVRAMTPADRKAVDKVLAKYFNLEHDGYHNNRADQEIAVASKVIDNARSNGKKGGRPKTRTITENETQYETQTITETGTEAVTETISQTEPTNNHPPTTNHQPPAPNLQPPEKSASAVDFAKALRALGISTANPQHPALLEWENCGVTAAQVIEAVRISKTDRGKPNPSPAYLTPILMDMLHPPEKPRSQTAQAIVNIWELKAELRRNAE